MGGRAGGAPTGCGTEHGAQQCKEIHNCEWYGRLPSEECSPPSQNRHAPLMYAFPLFLPPSQWCQPQIPKHYLRLTRVHVVAHKLHPHAPASHHR